MKRYGVRSSLRSSMGPQQQMWARRAGDVDRLLQQHRAAGECGRAVPRCQRTQNDDLLAYLLTYLGGVLSSSTHWSGECDVFG